MDDELVITVIETDTASAVIIATSPALKHFNGVGIVKFATSLDVALKAAYEALLLWEVGGDIHTIALEQRADAEVKKRTSISLSDEAMVTLSKMRDECGYSATVTGQGLMGFLRALVELNPTPEHWADTRSEHPERLDLSDYDQLSAGKLPLWSQAPADKTRIRTPRGITNPDSWKQIIPLYSTIGRAFGISPYRGGSFENPAHVASATVEAVGLRYLTPAELPTSSYTRGRNGDAAARARKAQQAYERFSF